MDFNAIKADAQTRMDGAIHSLKHSLNGLRTGRASAALLDPVKVEVYGNFMPLNQVSTISTPEARLISVQVWDKGNTKAVEKAIANAGLGLNPQSDGNLIRIPLPDLSEERRKELAKKAREYAEHAKIAIRNIRRDANDEVKKMEKNAEISEDQQHEYAEKIQKLTDEFITAADKACDVKVHEITHI